MHKKIHVKTKNKICAAVLVFVLAGSLTAGACAVPNVYAKTEAEKKRDAYKKKLKAKNSDMFQLGEAAFLICEDALPVGQRLEGIQITMGFLLGRKDVVHLIVQLFQGVVGEHQLLPPGLRLFQLLLELLPHGRQLRLFLIQLLFTLDQGVDPGAELGLCAVYFFLGVFQFFLFLVQLGGGIVQFTVDCSGDPVVQLVDQLLAIRTVQARHIT